MQANNVLSSLIWIKAIPRTWSSYFKICSFLVLACTNKYPRLKVKFILNAIQARSYSYYHLHFRKWL